MKKITWFFLVLSLIGMTATACGQREHPFKVYAWMSGKLDMPDDVLENYFSQAAAAGISGIYLECHGGYPTLLGDTTAFRDSAALVILRRAVPYAKKYGLELHAWMWTTNRCEANLLDAHPEWYQTNGLGESLSLPQS